MASGELPDWWSVKGTRKRVALWLMQVVGPGGVFTKGQLREAFPGVEQVDRRMRDLRPAGWRIATYREDRSLEPDELRLVTIGQRVWEPGAQVGDDQRLTNKQRWEVFSGDNFTCTYCGVGGGETYPDDPLRAATLAVARLLDVESAERLLVTVCDRCHVALDDAPSSSGLISSIDSLDDISRRRLRQWIRQDRRYWDPEDAVWAEYRRLPRSARQRIQMHLDEPV